MTPPIYKVKYPKSNLNFGPIIGGQVKGSSQNNKTDSEKKAEINNTSKDKTDKTLDKYDKILLDTFPASDAGAKY